MFFKNIIKILFRPTSFENRALARIY
jgi:hypothetical protein